jgi:hypothetical protein
MSHNTKYKNYCHYQDYTYSFCKLMMVQSNMFLLVILTKTTLKNVRPIRRHCREDIILVQGLCVNNLRNFTSR